MRAIRWLLAALTTEDGNGNGGRLSFSKSIVVAVLVVSVALREWSLGIAITLVAASFGRHTFETFLASRAVTATAATTTTVTVDAAKLAEIAARRTDSHEETP